MPGIRKKQINARLKKKRNRIIGQGSIRIKEQSK